VNSVYIAWPIDRARVADHKPLANSQRVHQCRRPPGSTGPPAANRADRATRILSLNQIDDEARPLNDTSNRLTGADEMMGIPV